MTYKIALSGSQGVGKTTIVRDLAKLLNSKGATVAEIESPSRYVKSLGFKLNRDGDWRTQLFSVVHRVTRQIEAAQSKSDFILSDRCLLDEMAYTLHHLQALEVPVVGEDPLLQLLAHRRLRPVQHQTESLFLRDLKSYWDVVYFKPRHLDFPPEGDGDRTSELAYQIEIESCFQHLREDVAFQGKTLELDPDISISVQQIWESDGVQKTLEQLWS